MPLESPAQFVHSRMASPWVGTKLQRAGRCGLDVMPLVDNM